VWEIEKKNRDKDKRKKGKERSLRLDKRRMDFFWGRMIVSHEHEKKKRTGDIDWMEEGEYCFDGASCRKGW